MPAKTLLHGKGHIRPPAVKVPDDGGEANVGVLSDTMPVVHQAAAVGPPGVFPAGWL